MMFERGLIGDEWIEVNCPSKQVVLIFIKQPDGSLVFDHTRPAIVDVEDYVEDAQRFAESEIAKGWRL